MRHSWAKAAQSLWDCVDVVSSVICRNAIDVTYHFGVSCLFRSIDEGFCDRLAPVDACAEDVEEESFELV